MSALTTDFYATLDPCTADGAVMDAKPKFTIAKDGLSQIWRVGTLFLNPPFSDVDTWVARLVNAYGAGVLEAIALLPARTDRPERQRAVPVGHHLHGQQLHGVCQRLRSAR